MPSRSAIVVNLACLAVLFILVGPPICDTAGNQQSAKCGNMAKPAGAQRGKNVKNHQGEKIDSNGTDGKSNTRQNSKLVLTQRGGMGAQRPRRRAYRFCAPTGYSIYQHNRYLPIYALIPFLGHSVLPCS